MRVNRSTLVVLIGLIFFALVINPANANAQSVEEAYDATQAAYNQTLNQMEECDLKFQEFQQMAKQDRPHYWASSQDWERWKTNYLFSVVIYRHCMDKLKREADNLKKKLAELEDQLDGAGPNTRTPSKDPKSPPRSKEEEAKRAKLAGELIQVLEKRLVKLEEDAKRAMEEMELRLKAEKASKPGFNVRTESNGRLWTTTFTAPEGNLVVNLPADMRAGDTVSGTVIANPKGQTEAERTKNLEKLNRYQLMIANQTVTGPGGGFTWSWLNPRPVWLVDPKKPFDQKPPFQPNGWALCPGQLMSCPETNNLFALMGAPSGGSGQVPFTPVAGTPIPEEFTTPPTESDLLYRNKIELPTDGQDGHDVKVEGRFNGEMKDTEVRIGGQRATVRAESPRSCVFESPVQNIGLTEISIKENNVETKGTYRNLGVRLTAPKTSLLKGEKTTVTIEVRGLEGIQKDVPLKLAATGVINMEGGNSQNLVIRPAEVKAGGIYTTTRGIIGQQAGAFGVTATVIHKDDKSTKRTSKVSRAPQPFSVLNATGAVSFMSAGKTTTAPPFGNVKTGDTIKTGADGIVLLELDTAEQTTQIVLDHNTELIYDPEKKDEPETEDAAEEKNDCPEKKDPETYEAIRRRLGEKKKYESHEDVDPDIEVPQFNLKEGSAFKTVLRKARKKGIFLKIETTMGHGGVCGTEFYTMKSADSFRIVVSESSVWMRDTEKKKITVNAMQMGFITLWDKAAFRETGTDETEKLAEEQARAALYATVNSLALDDKTTVGTLTGQNSALADKLKKALQTGAILKTLPKVGNKFAAAVEINGADMKRLIESLTERPMGKHAVGVTNALPDGVMARIEELRRQFKVRRPAAQ